MTAQLATLAYLLAAVLFILGMKMLNSPATARRGNRVAAVGMLIAVVATLVQGRILAPEMIVGGIAVGAVLGVLLATRIQMTQMPEMVAVLNGLGGGASVLVAWAEVARYSPEALVDPAAHGLGALDLKLVLTVSLSVLIGSVTLSGSLMAYGKLSGKLSGAPANFAGMRPLTALLALGALSAIAWPLITLGEGNADTLSVAIPALMVLALFMGILLVIPIGGADMPVVVSLLNSYSGLAAASTGFVLNNYALIVSGALVGASGIILSKIMCDAMNRSLLNVLIGGFGGADGAAAVGGRSAEGLTVRSIEPADAAVLLSYAQRVIVVPGYGLAVAQAQHAVRELADLLQANGVEVKYAIHPVAGRMPGHMNVLLAEANVPYDQLFEMDEVNDDFERADVALVIGANDVVNPAARTDAASPIYGMPILNADRAQNVIVLKRSMAAGYSGVENDLFYLPNTSMLFGDAKSSLQSLVTQVKAS